MEEEYVIINKTAMLKKIAEMDKGLETTEENNFEIDILYEVLSQSTPLIPEIAKAFDAGNNKAYAWLDDERDRKVPTKEQYISNLKLNI